MRLPTGLFLIAKVNGEAVGCGALKFHGGVSSMDSRQRCDVLRREPGFAASIP